MGDAVKKGKIEKIRESHDDEGHESEEIELGSERKKAGMSIVE